MSNSRIITTDFDYYAPEELSEALKLLTREDARPLAGGTDLINNIKMDNAEPKSLVYTLGIKGLDFLRVTGFLEIGAAVILVDIEHNTSVVRKCPALAAAVNVIGGTQIRNMATLAGNICNASPGADTLPVLMVLKSEVDISSLKEDGTVTVKTVSVENFFTGPKKTIINPGELVTAIRVPFAKTGSGQSFKRVSRVGLDIAKVNCAVYLERDGNKLCTIRIAFGSVAPTPVRLGTVEDLLTGEEMSEKLISSAVEKVARELRPIDDVRSTAEYRKRVAAVLLRDAVTEAWAQSGGR